MTGVVPGLRGAVREEMTMLVRQEQGHGSHPQGGQGNGDDEAKASSSLVQPPIQQPNQGARQVAGADGFSNGGDEADPGGATPPTGGGQGPISRPGRQPVERKHPGSERNGPR